MFKFITVTCLLLFFAFYELSGGANFVPLSERDTAKEQADASPRDGTSSPPKARVAATTVPVRHMNAPRSESVILASADTAPVTPEPAVMPTAVEALPLARVTTAAAIAPAREDDAPGLNAMIAQQAAGQEAHSTRTAAAPVQQKDMRAVTGNMVNLRLGPGTGYAVISKLGRGDRVEVIGGTGNWLKLRVNDGGRIGWMADWLVSGETTR